MRRSPHKHDDRGIVLIEFVLIAPILMMLLLGIVEFGQYYNQRVQVTGAARDGARSLALGGPADINGGDGITVSLSSAACPPRSDPAFVTRDVTATATMPYTIDVPLFPRSGTITVSGVRMRCGG